MAELKIDLDYHTLFKLLKLETAEAVTEIRKGVIESIASRCINKFQVLESLETNVRNQIREYVTKALDAVYLENRQFRPELSGRGVELIKKEVDVIVRSRIESSIENQKDMIALLAADSVKKSIKKDIDSMILEKKAELNRHASDMIIDKINDKIKAAMKEKFGD